MEKYFYTKSGIDNEVLKESILLRTTLRTIFIDLMISEKLDDNGALVDDNIEMQFSRALTSLEQDEITNLVNMVGPTYDLMIRKNIELNTMSWAQKEGMKLMSILGANNLYRQKTFSQVEALTTQYPELIHSMLTGSLTITKSIFDNMTPDANISQEEIDEFKLRVNIILGV